MKRFFDVFPTLEVKSDLRDYFDETEVERLTTNKEHTRIKIVLHSGHLIHKSRVYRMQHEIARQVFRERPTEVYIDEHYSLSAQYTPRRLMEEYYDSLCSEIGSFSHILENYFRDARMEYEGKEDIHVVLEDSCLSRKLAFKLEEALNRIFTDRCGVQTNLTVTLEERMKKQAAPVRRQKPLQGADAAFAVLSGDEPQVAPAENTQIFAEYSSTSAETESKADPDAGAKKLSFAKNSSGKKADASEGRKRSGRSCGRHCRRCSRAHPPGRSLLLPGAVRQHHPSDLHRQAL